MKTHELVTILRDRCDTFDPNVTAFMIVLGNSFYALTRDQIIDILWQHSDSLQLLLWDGGVAYSAETTTNVQGTSSRINIFAFQLLFSNN